MLLRISEASDIFRQLLYFSLLKMYKENFYADKNEPVNTFVLEFIRKEILARATFPEQFVTEVSEGTVTADAAAIANIDDKFNDYMISLLEKINTEQKDYTPDDLFSDFYSDIAPICLKILFLGKRYQQLVQEREKLSSSTHMGYEGKKSMTEMINEELSILNKIKCKKLDSVALTNISNPYTYFFQPQEDDDRCPLNYSIKEDIRLRAEIMDGLISGGIYGPIGTEKNILRSFHDADNTDDIKKTHFTTHAKHYVDALDKVLDSYRKDFPIVSQKSSVSDSSFKTPLYEKDLYQQDMLYEEAKKQPTKKNPPQFLRKLREKLPRKKAPNNTTPPSSTSAKSNTKTPNAK